MTAPAQINPMKGDSSANPFSPAGNPMSSGESGMSPAGDGNTPMPPMPAAKPETTKPRQMPGGATPLPNAPMGGGGGATPLGNAPMTGGDTNVPQPNVQTMEAHTPSKAMAKVREVRRDIVASNPAMPVTDAHHLAMQVVAFQFMAKAPDSIADNGSQSLTTRIEPAQQGRKDFSGGYFGDLNNPRNPYSPMHPNHPMHTDYQMGMNGGNSAPSGGQNTWAGEARDSGYGGRYPTLVGGAQRALNYGLDKAQDWFSGNKAPKTGPNLREQSQDWVDNKMVISPVIQHRRMNPKPQSPAFDPQKTVQDVVPGQKMAPQPPPVRRPAVVPAPGGPRGKPAGPAIPNKKVQDPKGHARDQRNAKDRARRKQRSNGTGDLGDAPRGRSSRSNLPGLTGSLVYLQAGER